MQVVKFGLFSYDFHSKHYWSVTATIMTISVNKHFDRTGHLVLCMHAKDVCVCGLCGCVCGWRRGRKEFVCETECVCVYVRQCV